MVLEHFPSAAAELGLSQALAKGDAAGLGTRLFQLILAIRNLIIADIKALSG